MAVPADNRSLKRNKIVECALKILCEHGDAGLTMRRIADCAEMRLSNVQYYFPSRNDVLAAMVDTYFRACKSELVRHAASCAPLHRRERARSLISEVLMHGDEVSDMCRVFRELWAISSRNESVRAELTAYYQSLCAAVAESIIGSGDSSPQKDKIGSLLLPYIEGYSITASSLPMPRAEIVEMLAELTTHFID